MKSIIKAFSILFTVALLILSLVGCGKDTNKDSSSAGSINNNQNVEYKDGEYSASAPNYDDSGFKATVKLVIKDGAIVSIDCDAKSKDEGTKKALSESGHYNMKTAGAQYDWHEEIALFERYVVSEGINSVTLNSNGKTDVITGCTIKVADYVDLINEALDKAKK